MKKVFWNLFSFLGGVAATIAVYDFVLERKIEYLGEAREDLRIVDARLAPARVGFTYHLSRNKTDSDTDSFKDRVNAVPLRRNKKV